MNRSVFIVKNLYLVIFFVLIWTWTSHLKFFWTIAGLELSFKIQYWICIVKYDSIVSSLKASEGQNVTHG